MYIHKFLYLFTSYNRYIDISILGKKYKFNLLNFILKKYLIFVNIIYCIYIIS